MALMFFYIVLEIDERLGWLWWVVGIEERREAKRHWRAMFA